MALQSSGTISLTQVATEFGGTAPHQMSEYFGVDAGVPASGSAIGLGNFYSKANKFVATITSNAQELNLYTWLTSIGWDQNRKVELTINSGVYIWSDNTSAAALNMGGTYPKGLTIINNGYIIGKGGNGGSIMQTTAGGGYDNIIAPTVGGPAINLTGPVSIDNTNGYIGGGGGGGAGAAPNIGGGGGAGGGLGGKSAYYISNALSFTANGPAGAIGQNGSYTFVNNNSLAASFIAGLHSGAGGGAGFVYYPIQV
jgi:hypothetical protein